MPFSPNASIISTDLDNMLRGLFRDNSDHALTGTLVETSLAGLTINGGIIGATGGLRIEAAGSLLGVVGTKTIKLALGSTVVSTIVQGAGTTSDWFFEALMMNTAANAQRWKINRNGNDLLTSTFDYTTSAENSAGNLLLRVNGLLGNVADTITCTMFNVFVVQIQ